MKKNGRFDTISADSNKSCKKTLNDKYGPGNWKKGSGTEYNKIIKWIVRSELAVYASTRPTPRQLQQLEKLKRNPMFSKSSENLEICEVIVDRSDWVDGFDNYEW